MQLNAIGPIPPTPPPHTPLPNHQKCISYCDVLPARQLLQGCQGPPSQGSWQWKLPNIGFSRLECRSNAPVRQDPISRLWMAATAGMGCIGRLPIRDQKLLRVGQKGLGWMGPLLICPLQASSNFFSREDASKLVCCILLKLFGVFIFTKQCWIRLAFNAPYVPLHDWSCPRTMRTECRRTVCSEAECRD